MLPLAHSNCLGGGGSLISMNSDTSLYFIEFSNSSSCSSEYFWSDLFVVSSQGSSMTKYKS